MTSNPKSKSDLPLQAKDGNIYHPPFSRSSHTVLRRKTSNKTEGDKQSGSVHTQAPQSSTAPPSIPELKPGGNGDSFYLTISASLEERGYRGYLLKRGSTVVTIPPTAATMDPGAVLLSTPYKPKYQLLTPKTSFATRGEFETSNSGRRSRSNNRDTEDRESDSRDITPTPNNRRPLAQSSSQPKTTNSSSHDDVVRRQQSTSSQLHRSFTTKKKSYHANEPAEISRERVLLERVDTSKSLPGTSRGESSTKYYNVQSAIVAPVVHLARVVSISRFDDGSMNPASPMNTVVLHRFQSVRQRKTASSLISNGQTIASLQQGSKVGRTIRGIMKASFLRSPLRTSEFEDDSTDEDERPKKSLFNLRNHKVKELPPKKIKKSPPKNQKRDVYCSQLCVEPGCFHDCDVLHIKTKSGHDCLVLENVDGKSTVVAGTLDALLYHLCKPIGPNSPYSDPSFTDRFLRICGGFIKIREVINVLVKVFCKSHSLDQKQRIIDIIQRWFQIQPEDLLEEGRVCQLLLDFIDMLQEYGKLDWFMSLHTACEKFQKKLASYREQWIGRAECSSDELISRIAQSLVSSPSRSTEESLSDFLGMDTAELANYFAALDLILFRDASENRTVRTYHQSSFGVNTDREADAIAMDRVQRLLRRSGMIKDWVVYVLYNSPTDETGSKVIEKFIDLAQALKARGNFQTTISILNGLQYCSRKLEGHFKGVSVESARALDQLNVLLTPEGYSMTVAESSAPVVPLLYNFLLHVRKMERDTSYDSNADHNKRHLDINLEEVPNHYFPHDSLSTLQAECTEVPPLIDVVKHGMFFYQIDAARRKAWKAHDFGRLSRAAWIFKIYKPGRLAFCRKTVAPKVSPSEIDMPMISDIIDRSNRRSFDDLTAIPTPVTPKALPPSPPITPPTSTYFPSNRSSSLHEPGELDWMSESVEQNILQAHASAISIRKSIKASSSTGSG